MKLERFNNKKRQRMMVINLIIGIILFIGGISFYTTYALYETNKEFNVIKGTVPDFGYDVKLAVVVDNEKQDIIPTSPMGDNGLYYNVQVDCTSSKTEGLWDYNAWRLNLDYIESNSKCNLIFTSSMSKEEYDKYIQAGVAIRRNTYRGKDITEYYTGDKTINGKDLYNQISDGTFDDIYVGDYIVSENSDAFDRKIVWLIADLDNYSLNSQKHHATIIPAFKLQNASMNSSNTTVGGYANSEMVTSTLGTIEEKDGAKTATGILGNYIYPDFGEHILEYSTVLTSEIDENFINRYGATTTGFNVGATKSTTTVKRYLDLMSEVNVVGTIIWSSSGYDVGIDSRQYAIFQLRPDLVNHDLNGNNYYYWLKTVASKETFVQMAFSDSLTPSLASVSNIGVRPRFLID